MAWNGTRRRLYLHDINVCNLDPTAHTANNRALFQRLRLQTLERSSAKARIGATKAYFLGHSISPAGVSPNADKVAAFTEMPMPSNLKQSRALIGGIGYYQKQNRERFHTPSPPHGLAQARGQIPFHPGHGSHRPLPPILVFSNYDNVTDNPRPFLLCCDASRDVFGATLAEQPHGSIRPILFISRVTLDSECSFLGPPST